MSFPNKFPSTKLNDINLDWLLKKMKELWDAFTQWPKTPEIQNGNWYIWDDATQTYVDSGQAARGPEGQQGIQGPPGPAPYIAGGTWWIYDAGSEAYIDTHVPATGPAGPQGPQGLTGGVGPQGPQGVPGAYGPAPYIGANDNWYIWNDGAEQYQDSGVSAKGERGPQGEQGPQGGMYTPGNRLIVEDLVDDFSTAVAGRHVDKVANVFRCYKTSGNTNPRVFSITGGTYRVASVAGMSQYSPLADNLIPISHLNAFQVSVINRISSGFVLYIQFYKMVDNVITYISRATITTIDRKVKLVEFVQTLPSDAEYFEIVIYANASTNWPSSTDPSYYTIEYAPLTENNSQLAALEALILENNGG